MLISVVIPTYNSEDFLEETLLSVINQDYKEKEDLLQVVEDLSESNPMMGLRGCRLGITYPEINEMQVIGFFDCAKHSF